VGFVAQSVPGEAFDPLVAVQFGNAFDQLGLVHLVRQLVDDDGIPAAAFVGLDGGAGTAQDAAAAGVVGAADAGGTVDDAVGREVRTGHMLHQLVDTDVRVVDQRQRRIHHLVVVVRRNVGGHADGNAGGAVDQQVGNARGQ